MRESSVYSHAKERLVAQLPDSDVVGHTVPEAHNADWSLVQEDGPKVLSNEKLTTSSKTMTH